MGVGSGKSVINPIKALIDAQKDQYGDPKRVNDEIIMVLGSKDLEKINGLLVRLFAYGTRRVGELTHKSVGHVMHHFYYSDKLHAGLSKFRPFVVKLKNGNYALLYRGKDGYWKYYSSDFQSWQPVRNKLSKSAVDYLNTKQGELIQKEKEKKDINFADSILDISNLKKNREKLKKEYKKAKDLADRLIQNTQTGKGMDITSLRSMINKPKKEEPKKEEPKKEEPKKEEPKKEEPKKEEHKKEKHKKEKAKKVEDKKERLKSVPRMPEPIIPKEKDIESLHLPKAKDDLVKYGQELSKQEALLGAKVKELTDSGEMMQAALVAKKRQETREEIDSVRFQLRHLAMLHQQHQLRFKKD